MCVQRYPLLLPLFPLVAALAPVGAVSYAATVPSILDQSYEHKETRDLVVLVNDASDLIHARGESGFRELSVPGSRWRQDDSYIFVLDPQGNMLLHPDPTLEGRNVMDLEDINGKPIVRGLIAAATTLPGKPEGWYHYEWPVPDGLLPRWKSSYVRLVTAPSGKQYIVGAGVYNDRMERAFVEDMVKDAVGRIETNGRVAFKEFYDPAGPFMAKNAYIFVYDLNGVNLVLPPFRNLEGRNLLDLKDTAGKFYLREALHVVETQGSGWVDYMWPKPGESVSTRKSSYVSKAKLGDQWVLVGCGVYLADAPRATTKSASITAPELMTLVRDAAALLQQQWEGAYPEFRKHGSKWFRDGTYIFVWNMDGTRVFHAADPASEGQNDSGLKDLLGRPIGKMSLQAVATGSGEGWIHYMYPEPGGVFPAWKSTFLKRITYPDGKQYIVGSGIYNMQMDKAFIEDVVNRASAIIAEEGMAGFPKLRDKTGPFVFMDTYVFVLTSEGIQVVNPGMPSFEGKNLLDLRDVRGKAVARDEIAAAEKHGSAWLECYWYKPGHNVPTRKLTFVRKVQFGSDTYIVGSGLYAEE